MQWMSKLSARQIATVMKRVSEIPGVDKMTREEYNTACRAMAEALYPAKFNK